MESVYLLFFVFLVIGRTVPVTEAGLLDPLKNIFSPVLRRNQNKQYLSTLEQWKLKDRGNSQTLDTIDPIDDDPFNSMKPVDPSYPLPDLEAYQYHDNTPVEQPFDIRQDFKFPFTSNSDKPKPPPEEKNNKQPKTPPECPKSKKPKTAPKCVKEHKKPEECPEYEKYPKKPEDPKGWKPYEDLESQSPIGLKIKFKGKYKGCKQSRLHGVTNNSGMGFDHLDNTSDSNSKLSPFAGPVNSKLPSMSPNNSKYPSVPTYGPFNPKLPLDYPLNSELPSDSISISKVPSDGSYKPNPSFDPVLPYDVRTNSKVPSNGIQHSKLPSDYRSNSKLLSRGKSNLKIISDDILTKLPSDGTYNPKLPFGDPYDSELPSEDVNNLKLPSHGQYNSKEPTDTSYKPMLSFDGPYDSDLPSDGPSNSKLPPHGQYNSEVPSDGFDNSKLPVNGTYSSELPSDGSTNSNFFIHDPHNSKVLSDGPHNLKAPSVGQFNSELPADVLSYTVLPSVTPSVLKLSIDDPYNPELPINDHSKPKFASEGSSKLQSLSNDSNNVKLPYTRLTQFKLPIYDRLHYSERPLSPNKSPLDVLRNLKSSTNAVSNSRLPNDPNSPNLDDMDNPFDSNYQWPNENIPVAMERVSTQPTDYDEIVANKFPNAVKLLEELRRLNQIKQQQKNKGDHKYNENYFNNQSDNIKNHVDKNVNKNEKHKNTKQSTTSSTTPTTKAYNPADINDLLKPGDVMQVTTMSSVAKQSVMKKLIKRRFFYQAKPVRPENEISNSNETVYFIDS